MAERPRSAEPPEWFRRLPNAVGDAEGGDPLRSRRLLPLTASRAAAASGPRPSKRPHRRLKLAFCTKRCGSWGVLSVRKPQQPSPAAWGFPHAVSPGERRVTWQWPFQSVKVPVCLPSPGTERALFLSQNNRIKMHNYTSVY